MSDIYEMIVVVLVGLLCSGTVVTEAGMQMPISAVGSETNMAWDEMDAEEVEENGKEENLPDTIIGEEEMKELQSWHEQYYSVNFKGEESEILQISGTHELENMQQDCYPELRKSLELHSQTHGDYCRAIIQRADKRVLSFLEETWEDNPYAKNGFRSEMGAYRGYSFDTETGKLLTLADVVADTDRLSLLLAEQLRSHYSDMTFEKNLAEQLKQVWNDADGVAWSLGYQGINFYFYPAVLGIHEEEILQAAVTFLQAPELFADKYRQVPAAYSIELRDSFPQLYDLDMNGVPDEIEVMYAYDNDPEETRELDDVITIGTPQRAADIRVNGRTVKEEKFNNIYDNGNSRIYLLHTAEGKNYIFAYDRSMYDCIGRYCVYDIAADQITYLGRDEIYLNHNRITDLDAICVESYGDPIYSEFLLITTYVSLKKDMSPENVSLEEGDNTVYYYEYPEFFKILTPLTVAKVDPYSGEVMEDAVELPADSFVVALRTNRRSWCDFITRDGNVYRLTFNPPAEGDYNYTYEGKNLLEGCLHYMNHDYAQYKADWWVW